MPYWMTSMLGVTPALVWMFVGVGLPYALLALPRAEWRERAAVACLTLAFGPAWVTAWMFLLGLPQEANLLRLDLILAGTAVIAAVGWLLTLRKWRTQKPPVTVRQPLRRDEKLLIGLIGVALVVRWLGVAYWPSTAYDALWVYAYQGKLYALLGHIPNSIGYYPPFLALQHAFLHLWAGGIDDHAARAVIPFLHLGSIFAVVLLGSRLFTRRVGIFAAALWALYPHVGEWSRYGDLEVPVTFFFTAAAVFFLNAWMNPSARRSSILGGVLLGIGMWTKPTMGAFIQGAALLALLEGAQRVWLWRRGDAAAWAGWRSRAEVLLWTGLACVPLGSVWYIRNVLNGHDAIDLPPGFWQNLAARSGVELGWPLLALAILSAWALWRGGVRVRLLLTGLVLVWVGVLPSITNTGRIDIGANRMGALEWLLVAAGATLAGWALWRWAAGRWTDAGREMARRLGWGLALALPYFVTWFYSYSYHYRLSFAIVPLLLLPIAVIAAHWTEALRLSGAGGWRRWVYGLALVLLALPGIVIPLYDINAGWDWLWTDKLPDDHARYTSGNAALMAVVDGLNAYKQEHPDQPLRVVAPEVKRLPFFFPLDDIRINWMPDKLDDLTDETYFIYGTPESGPDFGGLPHGANQVLGALSLASNDPEDTTAIMRRAWGYDDGIMKYSVFEMHLDRRFVQPKILGKVEGDLRFGSFVRLLGYDIGDLYFWPGRRLILHLYWEVLEPVPADYIIYIHFRDADGKVWQAWDGPVSRTRDGNYYSTRVWQPGEIITDERALVMENAETPPADKAYTMYVGLYDLQTNERLQVTLDGAALGDGYPIVGKLGVVAQPPS